jgi:O-antigen/teichoic acid export membrane protein
MYGANANAPFVFNADAYAITCVAFPSAGGSGGSLTSQQGEIDTLKTAMLNVQNEMAALTAGSITQAPNTDMLVAQAGVFGAFLVAGIAVLSLKWLYNLFRHRHDID